MKKLPQKIKTCCPMTEECVIAINHLVDYLQEKELEGNIDVAIHRIKELVKQSVWDLGEGDKYFRICGNGVITQCSIHKNDTKESIRKFEQRRKVGNVFLTKEDAEKELKQRIQIATSIL